MFATEDTVRAAQTPNLGFGAAESIGNARHPYRAVPPQRRAWRCRGSPTQLGIDNLRYAVDRPLL